MYAGFLKNRPGFCFYFFLPVPCPNLKDLLRRKKLTYRLCASVCEFYVAGNSVALPDTIRGEYASFTYSTPASAEEIHVLGIEFPA